jgi:hypothetical protein
MTPSQIEHETLRIGFLHAESYAEWVFRQCERWGTPWRDEYAHPDKSSPPFGPASQARQDRGLKILNHRGP